MGWNSQPTRMVIMEDVRVPAKNILGDLGAGFNMAMTGLNGGKWRETERHTHRERERDVYGCSCKEGN